jgi:MFS superfamily sulfate permease-like transporter
MDQASGTRDLVADLRAPGANHVGDRRLSPPAPAAGAPAPRARWAGALRAARLDRREIAGSLGDMGTFLPLLVGLSARCGLDFAAGLFFAGLFSLATGLLFAVPLAVQPMKAIAAVALSEGLTPGQIVAAGMTISLVILVLGLTGLIDALVRLVDRSVIRGLQLALGVTLLVKGIQMVAGAPGVTGPDSYTAGAIAALVVVLLTGSRTIPAALVLFLGGLVLAIIQDPGLVRAVRLAPSFPHWSPPSWHDATSSGFRAALPQAPLTALNSVVAVCALAADLFPRQRVTPRRVAVSVGLMNLVGGWFGAMPMCHGAGGLAGHYRFGARTNGANLFLGSAMILAAVLLGGTLLPLCKAFPASILGVMLAFSGLELALVGRDQTTRAAATAMLLTAGACLALNMAAGLLIGLAAARLMRTAARLAPEEPA